MVTFLFILFNTKKSFFKWAPHKSTRRKIFFFHRQCFIPGLRAILFTKKIFTLVFFSFLYLLLAYHFINEIQGAFGNLWKIHSTVKLIFDPRHRIHGSTGKVKGRKETYKDKIASGFKFLTKHKIHIPGKWLSNAL